MSDTVLKNSLIILAILLAAALIGKPLSKLLFDKSAITTDFVLETADGVLDSRLLRGKVLAIALGYTRCADGCTNRLARVVKGYEMLDARDRDQVRMILVSVDPDRDMPVSMGAYARGIHPDMIGASAKPDSLAAFANGFGATYNKSVIAPDGGYEVDFSHPIYLVDTEGRFVSALNENASPEDIAQALRSRLPAKLPPG